MATEWPFRSENEWIGESLRIRFENLVRRSHAKLRAPGGDLLLNRDVRAAGKDRHVQSFVLVISLRQGGIEASVLGLRIPVRLEDYFCKTVIGGRVPASQQGEAGENQDARIAEKTFGHFG